MGAKREGFLSLATCSGKDNNAASKLVGKLNAKVAKSPDTHDSYSVSGLDPLESRKRSSSAALKRCCVLIGDGVRDDVKEHLTPYRRDLQNCLSQHFGSHRCIALDKRLPLLGDREDSGHSYQ